MIANMLVLVVAVGCSSGDKADTEATAQDQSASQKQTTYGRTVEKAKETVAALGNPKEGIDPVCGMAIDENAVVVTIDDKDYGLCSQECADELAANPDKYLLAAAEGHDQ
jgi:YHS domain-containing protein